MADPQQAFRRLMNQLQRSAQSGGGGRGPNFGGRGLGAAGVVAALIGGGIVLSASLFNGACSPHSLLVSNRTYLQLTVVTEQ
jgi:prohibitin 2